MAEGEDEGKERRGGEGGGMKERQDEEREEGGVKGRVSRLEMEGGRRKRGCKVVCQGI